VCWANVCYHRGGTSITVGSGIYAACTQRGARAQRGSDDDCFYPPGGRHKNVIDSTCSAMLVVVRKRHPIQSHNLQLLAA